MRSRGNPQPGHWGFLVREQPVLPHAILSQSKGPGLELPTDRPLNTHHPEEAPSYGLSSPARPSEGLTAVGYAGITPSP